MRIAQVAPLFESVPPKAYGGTERVVSWLTEELVRQGHDVTLFASGDSRTRATLVKACTKALWQDATSLESAPLHVREMELVFSRADEFDVIHFHTDFIHLPLLRRSSCAALTTLHGALNETDHAPLFHEFPEADLVSISDAQRRGVPGVRFLSTIHHGMPLDLHTFRESRGEYLAFLGRISPQKGVDRAIRMAIASRARLKIAARIYNDEQAYFHKVIEPLLHEAGALVEFVGEVGGSAKDEFLRNAKALLFPIDWSEPFGLVMIEALATGTPVIARNNGSVPEVIEHGRTGFIIDSLEQGVDAIGRIDGIDRSYCRSSFERRFSVATMAERYVEAYERLRARRSSPRLLPFTKRELRTGS